MRGGIGVLLSRLLPRVGCEVASESSLVVCCQRRRSAAGASNASSGPLKRLVRRPPPLGEASIRPPGTLRLLRQLDGDEIGSRVEIVFTGFVDDSHVAGSRRALVMQHAVDLADLKIFGAAILNAESVSLLPGRHGSV